MQDRSAGVRLEQKRRGGHVDLYFNGKDKLIVVRRTHEFYCCSQCVDLHVVHFWNEYSLVNLSISLMPLHMRGLIVRDLVESSLLTIPPFTILDHKSNQFPRFVQSIYVGKDAVDWMLTWCFASTRQEAVCLANTMLRNGFFHAIEEGKTFARSMITADKGKCYEFEDKESSRYIFVSEIYIIVLY